MIVLPVAEETSAETMDGTTWASVYEVGHRKLPVRQEERDFCIDFEYLWIYYKSLFGLKTC